MFVLQQRGRAITPSFAFRGNQVSGVEAARSQEESGDEAEVERTIPLPDGISHRVENLFLLNLDMRGELSNWLGAPNEGLGA